MSESTPRPRPQPTPFELSIRHELEAEALRMANEWFFRWHNINIPNHVVDVPTFVGEGRFHTGGIVFKGQIQQLYWQAVRTYLSKKAHEVFDRWAEATKGYPPELRHSSLEAIAVNLRSFVGKIIEDGKDTDRRLRGKGNPSSVEPYNTSGVHSHTNAEIERLLKAHNQLIEKPKPDGWLRKIERFFSTWPGIIAGTSIILALVAIFV